MITVTLMLRHPPDLTLTLCYAHPPSRPALPHAVPCSLTHSLTSSLILPYVT